MLELHDRLFTADEARAVAFWAYDPPFDLYNLSEDEAVKLLTQRDEHGNGYYPVQEAEQVVGFVCLGPEARVRGQHEEVGTCDIGAGLVPNRLGAGLGTTLLPDALRFAVERFAPARVRAAVAVFNERSIRLCTSAGFRQVRVFEGPAGRSFVELALDIDK